MRTIFGMAMAGAAMILSGCDNGSSQQASTGPVARPQVNTVAADDGSVAALESLLDGWERQRSLDLARVEADLERVHINAERLDRWGRYITPAARTEFEQAMALLAERLDSAETQRQRLAEQGGFDAAAVKSLQFAVDESINAYAKAAQVFQTQADDERQLARGDEGVWIAPPASM